MSGHEREREPMHISDISRYYYDLYYSQGESATIVMSLSTLLDMLPFSTNLTVNTLYDAQFMEHELVAEPRVAMESLALAPLYYIGPLLDASECPTSEIKQWYSDAVEGVLLLTRDTHTDTCLEYDNGTLTHCMCEHSACCPRRILERYLADDVSLPNFSSNLYKNNPQRALAIAADKLQVGIDKRILLPMFSSVAWDAYDEAYDEYFSQLSSHPSQDGNKKE